MLSDVLCVFSDCSPVGYVRQIMVLVSVKAAMASGGDLDVSGLVGHRVRADCRYDPGSPGPGFTWFPWTRIHLVLLVQDSPGSPGPGFTWFCLGAEVLCLFVSKGSGQDPVPPDTPPPG